MARLAVLLSFVVALSSITTGLAGPACAHKYRNTADCVQKCKSKWGWTGAFMGTDRWGSVVILQSSKIDMDTYIAQACGSRDSVAAVASATSVSSTGRTLASSTALPTLSASASSSISSSGPSRSTSSVSAQGFIQSVRSRTSTTVAPSATPKRFTTVVTNVAPRPTTSTANAAPPANTPAAGNSGSGGGGTSSADIQSYLSSHNSIRSQHGADPLTWNNDLAAKAQQWADRCQFQHSGGSLGAFGENLAAGTGSDYGIQTAVKEWTDEVSSYNPNNPVPSHFTQVVWKSTKQLGCAVQSCNGIFPGFGTAKFFVCEYSPAGNVIGQFAQNVQV